MPSTVKNTSEIHLFSVNFKLLHYCTYHLVHQAELMPGEYLKGRQFPSPHPVHQQQPACAPKKTTSLLSKDA